MFRNVIIAAVPAAALASLAIVSCRDLEGFSTTGDEFYEGVVVPADSLRRAVPPALAVGTTMRLTLDVARLQSSEPGEEAGTMTTTDSLFSDAPLLPIDPLWHDTLSGLTFPEGRLRSVLYYVRASASAPAGYAGANVLAVLSLMVDGSVEVRLIGGPDPDGLYGVFRLRKTRPGG
ncbi:MAG: hypothetical protein QME96_02715 [Myxococcota bacterium]|nr:hypothetical protein [Myxococcota bacterium]